jgi:hypothetical protein
MDWIEAWLGLNLDGGDGSLEMLLLAGLAVVAGTVIVGLLPTGRRTLRAAARGLRGLKNRRPV